VLQSERVQSSELESSALSFGVRASPDKRARMRHTQSSPVLSLVCHYFMHLSSLFCLLHAFSSLSIFTVASHTTKLTQFPPPLSELEFIPQESMGLPPSSEITLSVHPAVTRPAQHTLILLLWQQLESNQHQAVYKKGCCYNDTINSSKHCSYLSSD